MTVQIKDFNQMRFKSHYENLPMQYMEFFLAVKVEYSMKNFFFLFFAQNIDCRYMLELPCQGGSNEYLQSMFWIKNEKNRFTPVKWGLRGIYFMDMIS